MKRVFITGAGGFIGQAVASALLSEYEVHGLVRSGKGKVEGVTYHRGDLLDFTKLVDTLQSVQPNFVLHLAARTEVEKSFYDPTGFSQTNYTGTVNMVEACRDLKNLELFVFSSTMETYGHQPKENWKPFTEETPQNPNAPYAVAKVACEYYLRYAQRAYGIPYCILRQTNAYGRHDNDFFVVEQFITQMLTTKNDEEVRFGNREPWRNFLYIDDLVELYKTILRNTDLARNEVFCTGPDNAIKIENLARVIADLIKPVFLGAITWGTKPHRAGEIYYLNSSHEKAKRVLGWEPKIDLIQGLEKTIRLWKEKLGKE